MLSATEIADAIEAVNATLVDACTIRRPTSTPDGAGGSTVDYDDTGPVDCLLMPASVQAQLELVAQAITLASPYVVRFAAGTDVRIGDELTISGRTFHVKAPIKGGGMELCRRVAVVEVGG